MIRPIRNLAFLALCMTLASVAFGKGLDAVKKAGKLRVAIDATYPPMEFEGDDGKPAGFDVEFAKLVAKELGVEAEFVVMSWDGILVGLQSGRYDTIISSMNITPERKLQANFVPYLSMSQVYVTKAGKEVTKKEDLAGRTIAVQADTTSHQAVEKMQKDGTKIKRVKAFKGATDAFAALKANQADVIVIDEPVGRYYALRDKSMVVSGQVIAPEPVGIALHKKKTDLASAIDKAVSNLKAKGALKELSIKWFGAELGSATK